MGRVVNMGRRRREATPPAMCEWLVSRVARDFGVPTVAVLWAQRRSNYLTLGDRVDVWDEARDARLYCGPWPVICHPPCGPWGQWAWRSKQSKEHGLIALDMLERWGGVIEQPRRSSLFRVRCLFGHIEEVNQSRFGHQAPEPTILLWRPKWMVQ